MECFDIKVNSLHDAAYNGILPSVKLLIEKGIPIDTANEVSS